MLPAIFPAGDHAVTISFGNVIDEKISNHILDLFYFLRHKNIVGVKDIIPAYGSLTIVYDIIQVVKTNRTGGAFGIIREQIKEALQSFHKDLATPGRNINIPVCYDASLAPDIETISQEKKISVEEIVSLHSNLTYRVYMIGFMPGFPYMGKVDERIAIPRKKEPRQSVAAGSVGIAGFQTGIYPFDSPGGWNIVGRTPLKLFDKTKESPCLLQPGDKVKFEPIGIAIFNRLLSEQ